VVVLVLDFSGTSRALGASSVHPSAPVENAFAGIVSTIRTTNPRNLAVLAGREASTCRAEIAGNENQRIGIIVKH
jgi:hypothetical protein